MGQVIYKGKEVKHKMKRLLDIVGIWTHDLDVCNQLYQKL